MISWPGRRRALRSAAGRSLSKLSWLKSGRGEGCKQPVRPETREASFEAFAPQERLRTRRQTRLANVLSDGWRARYDRPAWIAAGRSHNANDLEASRGAWNAYGEKRFARQRLCLSEPAERAADRREPCPQCRRPLRSGHGRIR